VLQNNGGDDLAVTTSGTFSFATPLASAAAYSVSVKTQPTTPVQTCTVANASGTVGAAAVTNVLVTCSTTTTVACGHENGTVVTHSANITASESWAGDGTVHLIANSINILAPATVTVQKCAIVKLKAAVTLAVEGDASGTGMAKLACRAVRARSNTRNLGCAFTPLAASAC
jgi:hypothetical protein